MDYRTGVKKKEIYEERILHRNIGKPYVCTALVAVGERAPMALYQSSCGLQRVLQGEKKGRTV